jgi:hypothetical protein
MVTKVRIVNQVITGALAVSKSSYVIHLPPLPSPWMLSLNLYLVIALVGSEVVLVAHGPYQWDGVNAIRNLVVRSEK